MDMFTPFAFNLLGIIVYTIILIPRCPWVLPIFAIMSIMNVMIEKKIAQRGYRKYRETIWETDSRVEYFFQRSTSATDGKDIRLYRMEKWFVDVMKTLVQRRMKVWKRVEMYYFLPHLSDHPIYLPDRPDHPHHPDQYHSRGWHFHMCKCFPW